MTIIIFTYNRPEMLRRLVAECVGYGEIFVIDDGSEYDYSDLEKDCTYIREPHGAKRWFYQKWISAFQLAQKSHNEDVLFLQDDVEQIDFSRLYTGKSIHVQHLLRMKRTKEWTGIEAKATKWNGEDYLKVGFVDCIYKTNKATLTKIGWYQPSVPAYWFSSDKISSGVGFTQSKLFTDRGVPIYLPEKTIAKHGNHDSVMHPELRKTQPLCTLP
jgi:hypothetical protein